MDTELVNERITVDVNTKRSTSLWPRLGYVISIINQILIGFVTIFLSWMCLRVGLRGVALHAWLCTIGFSFLMAEGIMTHYNANTLLFSYNRKTRTTIHWILQALGGCIGIAGGIVQICDQGLELDNNHAKLGFAALILCAASMLTGLSALFSKEIRVVMAPLLNKTMHNVLGISAFVIALIAQFYGYQTWTFRRYAPEQDFVYMIEVITLISLVLTCIGPLLSLWNKCITFLD